MVPNLQRLPGRLYRSVRAITGAVRTAHSAGTSDRCLHLVDLSSPDAIPRDAITEDIAPQRNDTSPGDPTDGDTILLCW